MLIKIKLKVALFFSLRNCEIILTFIFRIKAGLNSKLLFNRLLENYSIYEIPKSTTKETLQVDIGLSVQQIIDIVFILLTRS